MQPYNAMALSVKRKIPIETIADERVEQDLQGVMRALPGTAQPFREVRPSTSKRLMYHLVACRSLLAAQLLAEYCLMRS